MRSCYVRDITHIVPCRQQKVTSYHNYRSLHFINRKIDLHVNHERKIFDTDYVEKYICEIKVSPAR